MKILHVAHGFPPQTSGGTERAVEALARAMQGAGHDVTVVAGSLEAAPTDRVDEEDHGGLPVLRMHRDDLYFESWFKCYAPGVSATFEKLCAERQPDVVHVHHWIRLTSDLVRIARAAGATVAVTMHDYYTSLASPVRRAGQSEPAAPPSPAYVSGAEVAEAFAFHRRDLHADVCAAHLRCAPSGSHAAGLQEMAPGALGPIEVTPPPLLQVPARRPDASGPRQRRLVTWGTIYPDKGLETVLDALRAVDGWSLEVWGDAHDPEYRSHVMQRAQGLDIAFRGAFDVGDLARTAADYAVLPSMCHESYGLTMDEAQILGLPVLASDLPAYRERVPASCCAFFTPGDPGSLEALLRDEASLAQLAVPAPPQVVDAAAAAEHLLGLYEKARRGEIAAAPATEEITGRERARELFRRAERRLWTALQQPQPPAPPDDFV